MAPPPCELARDVKQQSTQTLVAKCVGDVSLMLTQWASAKVVTGAGAYAVVEMPNGDVYVVLVTARAVRLENAAGNVKAEILQLPGSPPVEWVRPLTRRLQRLFGWGDVASTAADVKRAAEAGDVEELVALMPQAASLIRRNDVEWHHLEALHDASRGALALTDRAEEDDGVPLRAVHEALGQHTWSERPNRKAQCRNCQSFDPYECDCGLMLCEQCRLPAVSDLDPRCSWRQHPTLPQPFYVHDHVRWPDGEKLMWMRQEIGDGAGLHDFAEKWLELFGEKFGSATAQKAACLKLYGKYAPAEARAWKNECNLPPDELEQFQRLWDPSAPERCRECAKASAPGQRHPVRFGCNMYCSRPCADAGVTIVCRTCRQPGCGPDSDGVPECTPVGDSRHVRVRPEFNMWLEPSALEGHSWELRQHMQRMHTQRWLMSWYFEVHRNANHEPAWKRRRRS